MYVGGIKTKRDSFSEVERQRYENILERNVPKARTSALQQALCDTYIYIPIESSSKMTYSAVFFCRVLHTNYVFIYIYKRLFIVAR